MAKNNRKVKENTIKINLDFNWIIKVTIQFRAYSGATCLLKKLP